MLIAACLAFVLGAALPDSAFRPAKIFSDGVVLQRGRPLPVWGSSRPGASVTVSFRGATKSATADVNGRWRVTLPTSAAGGPFEMTIASGGDTRVIRDVLVGDVWFASGQSNMEFGLAGARDGAQIAAAANDSMIREFKVPASSAREPEFELAGGSWAPADARHARSFSAVGYFFARDVRAATGIPIGIINSSWGGSAIEAWLSAGASGLGADAWEVIRKREIARDDSAFAALRVAMGGWFTQDRGMSDGQAIWAASGFDDSQWSTMPVPSYWDGHGYGAFDGVGWFRTTFTLDAATAALPLELALTGVDDHDVSWINGTEVGRSQNGRTHSYAIPAGLLRAGANSIVVRITDNSGGGGIVAPIRLVDAGTKALVRDLAGTWRFRAGAVIEKSFEERMRDGQRINHTPTLLFNKMVNPLREFPIAGVLWYQGESNANNAAQGRAYRGQFNALVTSWRREFSASARDVPFLWVQLPNYGAPDATPSEAPSWALVRESMDAALTLPATGRAVTLDIGEADDIHPRNKADVGARLARVALAKVYGKRVEFEGPSFVSWKSDGRCAVVQLSHADKLRTTEGKAPSGFALAGADRKFVWATAEIRGAAVRICSDAVTKPEAVRYAFANNPPVNLVNGVGLPASPFRTDKW
jgi:sialate O-acetylesterase